MHPRLTFHTPRTMLCVVNTWTATRIRDEKGKTPIVCLTAFDYSIARILDDADVQLLLVGDSLAMTVLGHDTTLPVTMEEMLHYAAAVARGTRNALVVVDMPFLSYQTSVGEAIANAGRFLKEAGAGAVKLEGGVIRAATVRALVDNGIPVMGHIGLTPQSIKQMGSYRVQGRGDAQGVQLIADSRALSDAGAFAVVLECVPTELARTITEAIPVPTIGIGAGPHCDGQVLVTHDMLGLYDREPPRFVKKYADLSRELRVAVEAYRDEVRNGVFPDDAHSY